MALGAKPVERAAHIQLLLRLHVEEREVNRRASRVSALGTDIFPFEEDALVEVGVEILAHQRVGNVLRPAHEVVDGPLGTVGIVDFQAIAHRLHVVADGLQAVCRLARQQGSRFEIAVDARADEVVCAEVPDFQNGIGHGIGQRHELSRVFRRVGRTVLKVIDETDASIREHDWQGDGHQQIQVSFLHDIQCVRFYLG